MTGRIPNEKEWRVVRNDGREYSSRSGGRWVMGKGGRFTEERDAQKVAEREQAREDVSRRPERRRRITVEPVWS